MSLVPPVNRSFMERAGQFSQGAISSRSAMRTRPAPPPKTVGGAIAARLRAWVWRGVLGSMTAAEGATGLAAVGGPWFLAGGAALGLLHTF